MSTYSVNELAKMYGTSKRTFERRLKVLRDSGLFKKTSLGATYNEVDGMRIAELLGFSLPDLQPPTKKFTFNFKTAIS